MPDLKIPCESITVVKGVEVIASMHRGLEPVLVDVDVPSLANAISDDAALRKELFSLMRDEISEFCLEDSDLRQELSEQLHPAEEDPL